LCIDNYVIYAIIVGKEGEMKRRDLIKKLAAGGYKKDRSNRHTTYEKPDHRPVQVPNHKEIDEKTARGILDDAGLL